MIGDKYNVHYTKFSESGTFTDTNGPWDSWRDAKTARDGVFQAFSDVQSCWIMVTNPSLELCPEKWGVTLRRYSVKWKYDSDAGEYHARNP